MSRPIPHYLQLYSVRFEGRHIGSQGAFSVLLRHTMAKDTADAVELVRSELTRTHELRFGGDVREFGAHEWQTPEGKVQPLLLPCQAENILD